MKKRKITYKSSGVDIDRANTFVGLIKKEIASTMNKNVLRRKGSFGGLFSLDKKYNNPVLVSSTDGVGTKLLIAQSLNKHDTVGIDLVAMNVNDILCVGAKPLFFLDYIACGRLDENVLQKVIKGIVKGCRLSGCSLVGGETAEMPGMYKKDEYDLAGFVVGVVDKKDIIDGSKIKSGDRVIGIPSSGLHSNGFSLVRNVLSLQEQRKHIKEILAPTRIYAKEVEAIINNSKVSGIAHITGGAFYEKLTKVLPKGKCFLIEKGSWPVPDILKVIQSKGNVNDFEMYKTFNMGIGLAIVVSRKEVYSLRDVLKRKKIKYYDIGEVVNNKQKKIIFDER